MSSLFQEVFHFLLSHSPPLPLLLVMMLSCSVSNHFGRPACSFETFQYSSYIMYICVYFRACWLWEHTVSRVRVVFPLLITPFEHLLITPFELCVDTFKFMVSNMEPPRTERKIEGQMGKKGQSKDFSLSIN